MSEEKEISEIERKKITIPGYQIYYVPATPHLDKDNDVNYNDLSYWCVRKFEVRYKLDYNESKNYFTATPDHFSHIVMKTYWSYGSPETEQFIAQHTLTDIVSNEFLNEHKPSGAIIKPKTFVGAQNFKVEDDPFALSLIKHAEKEGYLRMRNTAPIIPGLFEVGMKAGKFPAGYEIKPIHSVKPKPNSKAVTEVVFAASQMPGTFFAPSSLIQVSLLPNTAEQQRKEIDELLDDEVEVARLRKIKELRTFLAVEQVENEVKTAKIMASMDDDDTPLPPSLPWTDNATTLYDETTKRELR